MRIAGGACFLIVICLVFYGFLVIDDGEKEIFMLCVMVAVGIAAVLFFSWWFLQVRPLSRKPMHHYKCSKCAYTWET